MTPDRRDRYSRRALLKALGLGMGLLPLLDSEEAVAAAASGPKRFISVTWTNGIEPPNFFPPAGPLTAPLPPILSPLELFKSKVLAMRGPGAGSFTGGVDIQVMLDAGLRFSGESSYPSLLTGSVGAAAPVIGSSATASVDTLISDALKAQGFARPQLNLGVRPGPSHTSWGANGVRNSSQTNPYTVYSGLFGGTTSLLARRRSVLDYCIDDLTRFGARLGREDQVKIDAHLTSLRAIEQQLALLPGCHPAAPSPPGVSLIDNADYPTVTGMMIDLLAAAVRCDVARAITIDLIDNLGVSLTFPWLGIPTPNYEAISHQGVSAYPQKTQIDTWFYSQVARLVSQLAANPEGASTSLDNSVILVCNSMNTGWEETVVSLPYLIVGSGGGFFKQGTCVQFAANVPNNQLLTSVCHAVGLPVASVGSTYTGDLDAQLQA
jgi:uncharacterized protein DUF1552